MKSYYYCVEVNLTAPSMSDVQVPKDVRAATFISRSFMDSKSVIQSIESDITTRLAKFVKGGNIPVRVNETNPLHLHEYDQLQEQAKSDEEFANYLGTWDETLVSRMSIVDEGLESPEDEMEEVTFGDMPPKDYLLRYYVREYEDGIEVPVGAEALMLMPNSVH